MISRAPKDHQSIEVGGGTLVVSPYRSPIILRQMFPCTSHPLLSPHVCKSFPFSVHKKWRFCTHSPRQKIIKLSFQYAVATKVKIYNTKRFATPEANVPTFIFSAINQHLKWKTILLCKFHFSSKQSTNLKYYTWIGTPFYRKYSYIIAHSDTG